MPSDLSISSPSTIAAPAKLRAAQMPDIAGADAETRQAAAVQVMPNPRLRIDGDLGMVVIEFRDRNGEVANSIPTRKELASYQVASRAGDTAALPTGTLPTPDAPVTFEPRDA